MRFALGATYPTSRHAGLQLATDQAPVGLCQSRQHTAGGFAHVGTVEIQANAPHNGLKVLLAKAGISAAGATLGAAVALVDTLRQDVHIDLRLAWMRPEHLLNVLHLFPLNVM
jgi:hypothetical protein